MTRKLATIRQISNIESIPNADNIEVATVDGWKVVIRRGEFDIGDDAVYCEIDSFIPVGVAPFLTPKNQEPKEFNGVKGNRLKTVKLRKQISQGLLLPLSVVDKECFTIGDDLTEALGIQKYEPPIPPKLAGNVEGPLPGYVPKTDQERIQNLTDQLDELSNYSYEITEKLDGSSMTVIYKDGELQVCSRNYSLKESQNNTLWKVVHQLNLPEKLAKYGSNLALQGELVGEGIQKNRCNIKGQQFYLFDVYDIDTSSYLSAPVRYDISEELQIPHVPVTCDNYQDELNVDELLKDADGPMKLNKKHYREGEVYKSLEDPSISFKVISNKFLLKEDSK